MTGRSIDHLLFKWKNPPVLNEVYFYLDTDFGKIRVLDTKGDKPVLINVPDGPNVIEHHEELIRQLSKSYRVICFEYPGIGLSYPNPRFDYSLSKGGSLLIQVMDIMKIPRASLLFSCSNGFFAMKAAEDFPDRLVHLFLSQTPSLSEMVKWTEKSIPGVLKIPFVGQVTNALLDKKFARLWYRYALPKNHPEREDYTKTALSSLNKGGCFCLSSLVQGMKQDATKKLNVTEVPATLIWGNKDFTHRKTNQTSIHDHIKDCKIIPYESGHFPELECTKAYVQLVKEKLSIQPS